MIAPRFLQGAIALFLLLTLLTPAPAQGKAYNQTAKDVKKQQAVARKNGCIIAYYAKGQRPWPSARRNRPIQMYTVFKNRGSTPYENIALRFYKHPRMTAVLPNSFQAKPAQPNAQFAPDPTDPNYFFYGPITVPPGTTKIVWSFTLANCSGGIKSNVTMTSLVPNPLAPFIPPLIPVFPPLPPVPTTCYGQEFSVRMHVVWACALRDGGNHGPHQRGMPSGRVWALSL